MVIANPWIYRGGSSAFGGSRPVATDADGGSRDIDRAAARARADLEALAAGLRAERREDQAAILEAQALMAVDPELIGAAHQRVASGESAAEAVRSAGDAAARLLEQLDDTLLAARAADVRDVTGRILAIMAGDSRPRLDRRSVAVADDLPPSVAAELDRALLAGIAIESGSPASHAAILARGLGIPAVVAARGVVRAAEGAGEIAIDGDTGEIVMDPGPEARARILGAAQADDRPSPSPSPPSRLRTRDGHRVTLTANIGHPMDASPAVAAGAEGIGLFRTEFLFMGRGTAPDEATQLEAYRSVLEAVDGRRVVFRLLDVGGDKGLDYLDLSAEANPFLGVRGLRVARRDPELMLAQLRAIYRAAYASRSRAAVMAPMVADVPDLTFYRDLVATAAQQLDDAGTPRAPRLELGIMVEVPSAVLLADQLAAAVDFLSIGTNDLTQYLVAADRTNPALTGLQDPMHPAVLRAVGDVAAMAAAHGVHVGVCGEMAADPAAAVVLVGMGIDELSMQPMAFKRVGRAVAAVSHPETIELAERCRGAASAEETRRAVTDILGTAADGVA